MSDQMAEPVTGSSERALAGEPGLAVAPGQPLPRRPTPGSLQTALRIGAEPERASAREYDFRERNASCVYGSMQSDSADPISQELEVSNGTRQYDFLRSMVSASLARSPATLSEHLIKALNFHAIACLYPRPGEYRLCQVPAGSYLPPEHYLVPELMEYFVNRVNRQWETADPVMLATYVLWGLNWIHPF